MSAPLSGLLRFCEHYGRLCLGGAAANQTVGRTFLSASGVSEEADRNVCPTFL